MTKQEIEARRQELTQNIENATRAAEIIKRELDRFNANPAHNLFDTLQEAEGEIEDALLEQAAEDCEGAYNVGQDRYEQGFFVGDQEYLAVLDVEYNRHDKTYYYIEESRFTVTPVQANA